MFLRGEEIGTIEIKPIMQEGQRGKKAIFMRRSNTFLILSLIVLGGVSIILSFIFSKKLTDPIKRLTAASKEISEGNIKSRVFISGNDEIGKLGKTFNIMANNLEVHESLRKKLTSNIAHELRTPLTAIQGELEGMMDGLIPIDNERLSSLHEEAARLKKIIEGIEELSKAEASILSLRRETFNLKTYLENIVERFKKLFINKGVYPELICDESLEIKADPDKLSQIVINLLDNALRVTDNGGTVTILAGKKGSAVFIQVKDTGRGIKKEDIPFVFERFYKSYDGGLGIGLTIAKELAEAHGGSIEVQSEDGKGATFTVLIKK
jgi:two-component system sensor histidine kinase BaeS